MHAGRADRTGVRALVTGDVTLLLRSKKLHALLSSGIRCAAWAWDGQLSPRMDTVTCSCAMSNHASCACAGMLLLAHGTHMHLSCVCACLAGVPRTPSHLVHAGRWRRKTRLCGSSASVAATSRLCLPRPWLMAVDQLHSGERLWHAGSSMHAAISSRLCRTLCMYLATLYSNYLQPGKKGTSTDTVNLLAKI